MIYGINVVRFLIRPLPNPLLKGEGIPHISYRATFRNLKGILELKTWIYFLIKKGLNNQPFYYGLNCSL